MESVRYGGGVQPLALDVEPWFGVWLVRMRASEGGMVIGQGESREAAVERAVRFLEWATNTLQQPAPLGVLDKK